MVLRVYVRSIIINLSLLLNTGENPDTYGRNFIFTLFVPSPSSRVYLEILPQLPGLVQVNISSEIIKPEYHLTLSIESEHTRFVSLPPEVLVSNTGIHQTGVLLTSSADVSVVLRYENQTDTCLLLPKDVLGKDYSILMGVSKPGALYVLVIIATQPNTTVSMTTGPIDDQRREVNLSTQEAYVLRSNEDMNGLLVSGNKPFAVWTGQLLRHQILSEMTPPINAWGRKFVLIPPNDHTQITSIILVRSNSTIRVNSAEESVTYDLIENRIVTLTFNHSKYVHIQSNQSALVLQLTEQFNGSKENSNVMFYVPPVEQYLNRYTFSVNGSCDSVCLKTINPFSSVEGLLLDGKKLGSVVSQLTLLTDQESYQILAKTSLSSGLHMLNHVTPTYTFCAYASQDAQPGFQPLGMRLANLYDLCLPTMALDGGLGDGIDNDCDGFIDEELLNGLDDDGDGFVDEDTAFSGIMKTSETSVLDVDSNLIAVIVSLTVAIVAIVILIGSCLLHDFLKRYRGLRSTRITPFVS